MRPGRQAVVCAAIGSILACGAAQDPAAPPSPLPVASVVVTSPSSTPLLPEGTRQLTATAYDGAGRVLRDRAFTWSTSTPTLLEVSAAGLVTAILPGDGEVSATSEGKSGSLIVGVVAPTLEKQFWFTGHIGASINNHGGPPPGFGYGFGFYTSVHELWPEALADVQLGWGTWLYPDNRGFMEALCPVGTKARDHFPTWGPTWDGVYQTIEGGAGAWLTNRFPAARTKYRINGTPDCYDTEVQSPGWSFYGDRLAANRIGLAQLSNRLLIPPDGFVFMSDGLFGNAWMALPLIPAYTNASGLPIGDRSLTLFTNAANFGGAVAFYTPEIWEMVHLDDATARGRGHDARPMHAAALSVEMGSVAFFTGTADGVRYRRLPRLRFPADGAGRATLIQEPRFYSSAAAWDPFAAWLSHGAVPSGFGAAGAAATLEPAGFSVTLGGDGVTYPADFRMGPVATSGGAAALGIEWRAGSPLESGVFPEYYMETIPGVWSAVPASAVPRRTWLLDQRFDVKQRSAFPALDVSSPAPFASARWSGGPFTTTLSDGSTVEYVWYRFVDQPAIARLGLSDEVLAALQTFAESFHLHSGTRGVTMASPASGVLATMDPALIITPPAGLELGHVPIVIRQY
jgi:hypothetical protein